jgi:translation initiation factor IF-2
MNPNSIQQLTQWRNEVLSKIDVGVYFPIVVIRNKIDLKDEYCFEHKEINYNGTWSEISSIIDQKSEIRYKESEKAGLIVLQWCRNNSYPHLETSAKKDVCISDSMLTVASLVLQASVLNKIWGTREENQS